MIKYKNKLLKLICSKNKNIIKYIEYNEKDYFEIIIPNRNNKLFLQIIFDAENEDLSVGYNKVNHIHYDISKYRNNEELASEVYLDYIKDLDFTYETNFLDNTYCKNIFKNTYYNLNEEILEISFSTGLYQYKQINLEVVKEFNSSIDKWKFFNSKIRNNYITEKIVSYESIF